MFLATRGAWCREQVVGTPLGLCSAECSKGWRQSEVTRPVSPGQALCPDVRFLCCKLSGAMAFSVNIIFQIFLRPLRDSPLCDCLCCCRFASGRRGKLRPPDTGPAALTTRRSLALWGVSDSGRPMRNTKRFIEVICYTIMLHIVKIQIHLKC